MICFCLSQGRIFGLLVPTPKHRRGKYSQYLCMNYAVFARPTTQIFFFICQETLQAATSTGSGLKGNRLMHLLCKFHTHACYPWQVC